jgi:hypothetical protein
MLSKKTKYGIKALTFLARQENQNPIPISEIAKAEHISVKFLESILLIGWICAIGTLFQESSYNLRYAICYHHILN